MNIINATPATAVVTPSSPTTPLPITAATGNNAAKSKPAIAFIDRSTDALLILAISRIIESMTGNAAYSDPVPSLAVLSAAYEVYVSAVNTLDRGQAAQIRRNNARAAVSPLLRDLALYVQHTCQGDLGVLVSSGFPTQIGRGRRSSVLDAPLNLRVSQGALTGQLRVQCKAVRAARSYQWRFATAVAPTVWMLSNPTTSSRYVLEGLTAGTGYLMQVRAVGTQGASNWSESAASMVM